MDGQRFAVGQEFLDIEFNASGGRAEFGGCRALQGAW